MERKRYSDSQFANIIRNWLGEESEDDDNYCRLTESSDDEIDDILIEDAAETDDSRSSSAEEYIQGIYAEALYRVIKKLLSISRTN